RQGRHGGARPRHPRRPALGLACRARSRRRGQAAAAVRPRGREAVAGRSDDGLSGPHRPAASSARGKIFGKKTIDLQWQKRADYNEGPCGGEEKAAGAETMARNEKNNAQNNRNSRKYPLTWSPCGPWRHTCKRPPMSSGGKAV